MLRLLVVDRVGTAGKYDALRSHLSDLIQRKGRRVDLTIDMTFTHPAGDKLIVLSAEVHDYDHFLAVMFHRLSFRALI